MPTRTYMVIDPRRDHSLRVPRPDLGVSLGTPDACTNCHTDRDPAWAAAQVRAWYGHDARGFQQFAEAFGADEDDQPGAAARLAIVAGDPAQPAIVRASALHRLATRQARDGVDPARAALTDPTPLVRRAALAALVALPPAARPALAAPLLDDVARAVRLEAAWQLASTPGGLSDPDDREAIDRAAGEFVLAQQLVADRPEGRATLAAFYAQLGQTGDATREYRATIAMAPAFVPAYVNLAELLRLNGDEPAADAVLREGLMAVPGAADLHYARGLSLARARQLDEAVAELAQATWLAPANARFAYAHAVGLHSAGRVREALEAAALASAQHPTDRDLLVALATFNRDAGHLDAAIAAATRLRDLDPASADAGALLASLEASRRD
jgi:Flp pilus assembly protein TadD